MGWKYINRQCKWKHICIDCLDVGDFPYYLHSYYLFNVFETYTNVSILYFSTVRIISFTTLSCIDSGPRRLNLLPACLCVVFSLLLCLCPSLYPPPPNLPFPHTLSHTPTVCPPGLCCLATSYERWTALLRAPLVRHDLIHACAPCTFKGFLWMEL